MKTAELITGFDHAMIGVRNLDDVSSRYRELGFDVVSGGRHPGRGTENALMRFGWGFIEFIAIHDPAERARLGQEGQGLTDFLENRQGGFVDVILESRALDELVQRFAESRVEVGTPFPLGRVRPDGLETRNRILATGPVSTRHLYPGFIEWEQPDPERLSPENQTAHPNGASEVVAVSMIVNSLDEAKRAYCEVLDLPSETEEFVPALNANRVRCRAGSLSVDLLAAKGPGVVQAALAELEEGLFEVHLRVKDLHEARSWLNRSGIDVQPAPGVPQSLLLSGEDAAGARLVLLG